MRIQDSLLYQDYSYIVKVGRSINDWRDTYKKTLHSSGFYFVGEVDIQTQLNLRLKQVTGINSSVSEPILGVLKTIFSTILGRRLGTTDDGTTLRSNPHVGVPADLTDSTIEHFSANTRDVTLTREYKLIFESLPKTTIRSNTTKFGAALGPNMRSLGNMILNKHFASRISVTQLNALRLMGTKNTAIDGELNQLSDFTFKLKTDFAIPSEVFQISGDSFDEDRTSFDTTSTTFDKA